MKSLTNGEKHLLRLVRQGKDSEGWAKVSATVWRLMQELPPELVTLEHTDTGGRAKLTDVGEVVMDWQ